MKEYKMAIIESTDRVEFCTKVAEFYNKTWVAECKFQRNLYYAGIGSSAGHTPGSTQDLTKATLAESFVAFIVYGEKDI